MLYLCIAVARLFQHITNATQVDRIRVSHFDQGTASEINAEGEAANHQ